jgi:hypothetical protein
MAPARTAATKAAPVISFINIEIEPPIARGYGFTEQITTRVQVCMIHSIAIGAAELGIVKLGR